MSFVNFAKKEVILKVVYYGPAECGKTTNLLYLNKTIQEQYRGDILMLDSYGERTLFFDFFPIYLGEVEGFKVRFQLYTVPGQIHYRASRMLVLDGVDGIVFVIDSQIHRLKENFESWEDMVDNLKSYKVSPKRIPIVLQYNKRDLPEIIDLGTMEMKLRLNGVSVFEAIAVNGKGVFPTIRTVCKEVIERFKFGS